MAAQTHTKAVIYDLDGTCVDSLPYHHRIISEACKLSNVPIPPLEKMCQYWHSPHEECYNLLNITFPYNRLGEIYKKVLGDYLPPLFSDLIPTLDELSDREIKVFLITANIKQHTTRVLFLHKIADKFLEVFCDISNKREYINLIKSRNNLSPSEIIFIGDTKSDILDGKAAGVRVVGFDAGYGGEESLRGAGAEVVIKKHKQLLEIL